jgi:NADPH:quinone reductase-like Zn-dependent oxidoreductase
MKQGGVLISLAKPLSQEQAAAFGVRAVFFVVESNPAELAQIGQLIDAGHVRPLVAKILPLSRASEAYEYKKGGRAPGKIVLHVTGSPET